MNTSLIKHLCTLLLRTNGELSTISKRCYQSHRIRNQTLDKHRTSPLNKQKTEDAKNDSKPVTNKDPEVPTRFLQKNPEFLPNPDWGYRDQIAEMVERNDMYRRRRNIFMPEFYVGSILAVTLADKFALGKTSRFLGLCIYRGDQGLHHKIILRNVIDNEGVEMMYELYSPLIQKIEVIKLERRLDDELFYLRDCPLEYSYFPQDMESQNIFKDMPVTTNTIKVKLNPRPWSQRWERVDLQGVEPFTGWKSEKQRLKLKRLANQPQVKKEWEKMDLMKHYRESIPPEESMRIYGEVVKDAKDWKNREERET
ncbi:39S ribosomal protein L19, mitochondrial-like [Dreissena polymorpha]|uniref:Large ribosomal subunit protein bL19m n=1 Tax=Dreissena polymorpha TaxID=45954 RepID=A0A9D4CSC8_DREPO|nr:39S ribosomal protein L19, mitochondrial-like [Dreissena polymorpha]KAH3729350.1 hypothetical protein DPMN_055318 [Dreissena polymorpha]